MFQGVFPVRDISVPHRVAFIKFAAAVISWLLPQGWAVLVSLFQIFLYTPAAEFWFRQLVQFRTVSIAFDQTKSLGNITGLFFQLYTLKGSTI